MKLPFEADAADELEAAVTWYERERAGHGDLFASAVRRTLDRAARFPQSGIRAAARTDHLQRRCVSVRE